jgi:hypothetical protein
VTEGKITMPELMGMAVQEMWDEYDVFIITKTSTVGFFHEHLHDFKDDIGQTVQRHFPGFKARFIVAQSLDDTDAFPPTE